MTATLRSFLWSSHPQSWAGNGNCRNHFRKTWSTGVNSHLMQLLLQFLLRLLPWLLLRLHLWNCPSGRSAPYHHQSSTPLKTSHQRRGRYWTEHHHHQNHQPAIFRFSDFPSRAPAASMPFYRRLVCGFADVRCFFLPRYTLFRRRVFSFYPPSISWQRIEFRHSPRSRISLHIFARAGKILFRFIFDFRRGLVALVMLFRSISSSSPMARLEWRGRLVMIGCGPTRWTVPEMKPQQEPRKEPQKKLQQELHK